MSNANADKLARAAAALANAKKTYDDTLKSTMEISHDGKLKLPFFMEHSLKISEKALIDAQIAYDRLAKGSAGGKRRTHRKRTHRKRKHTRRH